MSNHLLRLACPVQRMEFGPHGDASLAYQMFEKGGHNQHFGEKSDGPDTPFAELWMGSTHDKGESIVPSPAGSGGKNLSDLLMGPKREHFLGKKLLEKFPIITEETHGGIPFIFKVLSAGVPLPLQVHPSLEQGKKLKEQHKEKDRDTTEQADITIFDCMHKPEIALALTDFEAFIGFAPPEVIGKRLLAVSELRELGKSKEDEETFERLTSHSSKPSKDSWKKDMSHFSKSLFSASKETHKSLIAKVLRGDDKDDSEDVTQVKRLIRRCNDAHPGGDSGVLFAPLFMNYARLRPGECIYAPADTVHAWISGSIIECMPSSVNVINTGFGPNPSDRAVELFTEMLSYEARPLNDFMLTPQSHQGSHGDGRVHDYRVPEEEFSVLSFNLMPGQRREVDAMEGPSVIFGLDGAAKIETTSTKVPGKEEALNLTPGSVVLIASGTAVRIVSQDDPSSSGFAGYMSYCHLP